MSRPIVADNKPKGVELESGKDYYFCRCGRSKTQPFCDGSHAGSDFTPLQFTAEADGTSHLCQCKQTGNAPYCDGTHARVPADQIGREFSLERAATEAAPEAKATPEEPTVEFIHELARDGLSKMGRHGPMGAMGVPRKDLPHWDQIQIIVAQLARQPLLDDIDVATELVIGPEADKPLKLDIPLFVSDMSFGSLSEEAKVALSRGAERAGTGICSGEGGMLPEEQQANSRYFYELASAKFGYDEALLERVQAFHFKCGQGAKTGTGGHLPAAKNVGKISEVRGLEPGTAAVSPATFTDLHSVDDFKRFGDRVREITGGIPALARARHILDRRGASGRVTLIATGGLRLPPDFVKAMALGADGIALANSAIQAVGCIAARICHTNLCPSGVATQNPELRKRLDVDAGAERLARFFESAVDLMKVLARACGHASLAAFNRNDIATWHYDLARLAGIEFSGYRSDRE